MSYSSAEKRSVKLNVEALESRLTPDATSYVEGLYATVLHRTASQSDISYWVNQLQTSSFQQVAAAFWLSPEHRGLEVDSYYQNYLGRTESAADRQYWVNRFTNGGLSEVQVQLGFLTSTEFMNDHAGNTNYVEALYQDVLGRPADSTGLAYWTQLLQNGESANSVALGIMTSQEGQTRFVNGLYTSLLNRPSDSNGLAYWVNKLNDNDPGDTDDFNALNFPTNNDSNNNEFFSNLDRFDNSLNNNHEISREGVAVGFLTSAEFIGDH